MLMSEPIVLFSTIFKGEKLSILIMTPLDLPPNNLSLRNAVILGENCEKRGEILVIPQRALSNLETKLPVAAERIIGGQVYYIRLLGIGGRCVTAVRRWRMKS